MITVKIYSNQQGKIVGCEITGHAESGKKGYDIVCAGVSSLTQTALLGLKRYLKADLVFEIKDGFLYFSLQQEANELTEAILQTMTIGLSEIANTYKKNVQIEHIRR